LRQTPVSARCHAGLGAAARRVKYAADLLAAKAALRE
jgi:hypothetical protein